jgi:PAS domain S-box-containing protein
VDPVVRISATFHDVPRPPAQPGARAAYTALNAHCQELVCALRGAQFLGHMLWGGIGPRRRRPAPSEMLGYSAEEILGRYAWDFEPESGVPEALERQRQRQCGRHVTWEILFLRRDGRELWVRTQSFALYDEQGRVAGSIGMLVDITEQRAEDQARARLAAIVASFPDAIIGTSAANVIESWNEGAERLYGYTAEEAIGRHVAILASADRQDEVDSIGRQIAQGRSVFQLETVRRHKNGQDIDVLLTVSRFGRVPGSRMRAGHVGTGLGLFLGRAYAEAMSGKLELESTGPGGSVFSLRLPLCTVPVRRSV